MEKSAYNCKFSRSTCGSNPYLYCGLRKGKKRLVSGSCAKCSRHQFAYVSCFSIPAVKEGAK